MQLRNTNYLNSVPELQKPLIIYNYKNNTKWLPPSRNKGEKKLNNFCCATPTGTTKSLKGTVSREKLFNWGLGEMDWTLTIDRTWYLHFPDQLFNC